MNRSNRHTLYYRLIDISFGCQLLMVAAALFKSATGTSAVKGVLYYPFAAVAALALIIPPLLIFQRWMRDDFSEMLWQKAAGTVLKALVVLTVPVTIVVSVLILKNVDPAVLATSAQRTIPTAEASMRGAVFAMLVLWFITPLFFTFAFQWHRWRASR